MNGVRRTPRRITKVSLERAALFQLERRALSVAQLRLLLERKVKRSERVHGPSADAPTFIDDVIARCEASGWLDDARVAEGRVRALRASGASARGIAQRLRSKGIDDGTAKAALAHADRDDDDAELAAARIYARKRKLATRPRDKALAAFARRGFSFAIAHRVLEVS